MNNTGISWNFKDLTGLSFGKLTVLHKEGRKQGRVGWLCKCECGNEIIANDKDFKRVKISCGCHLLKNKSTKVCVVCGKDKPKSEYHKSPKASGVQSKCIECIATYKKERYWSNRENELDKLTKSRSKPENIEQRKRYYQINKESYHKSYLKYKRSGAKKIVSDRYRKKHAELLRIKARQKSKTKESMDKRNRYHDIRKVNDMQYVLKRRLRCRVRHVIRSIKKGAVKHKTTMELLGCDIVFFKIYIEDQFTDGMCWERISEIDIDHIKPCSKFDLTKKEEQEKCFFYKNLQPLWHDDNLRKGSKYPFLIQ